MSHHLWEDVTGQWVTFTLRILPVRLPVHTKVDCCRHPMPDYYSVMLEIAKDRATAASMVTCSTGDFDAGRCPDTVSTGNRYLRRAVNEPCQKLVSLNRTVSYYTNAACSQFHRATLIYSNRGICATAVCSVGLSIQCLA